MSKKLAQYVPSHEPKEEELEGDDRNTAPDVVARWVGLAQWFDDRQEFQFTDIREGAPVASD